MATIWFDSSVIGLSATHYTQPSFRLKVAKVWLFRPLFRRNGLQSQDWARQIMRQLRFLAMRRAPPGILLDCPGWREAALSHGRRAFAVCVKSGGLKTGQKIRPVWGAQIPDLPEAGHRSDVYASLLKRTWNALVP